MTTRTMNDLIWQVVLPLVVAIGIGGILYYVLTGHGDRYKLRDAVEAAAASRTAE